MLASSFLPCSLLSFLSFVPSLQKRGCLFEVATGQRSSFSRFKRRPLNRSRRTNPRASHLATPHTRTTKKTCVCVAAAAKMHCVFLRSFSPPRPTARSRHSDASVSPATNLTMPRSSFLSRLSPLSLLPASSHSLRITTTPPAIDTNRTHNSTHHR